jgi:lysine-N-methylase
MISPVKRSGHPDDLTMRYMQRFECIGDRCEDNCCRSDWVVEIDVVTLGRMKRVTAMHSAEERKRWLGSLQEVEHPKTGKMVTAIRARDGKCPMLEGNGLCHIHGTFGFKMLSDVCAIYPRRLQKVGEALELSGMTSCPEMARQVLWHADSIDLVPLDRTKIARAVVTHGMDPRDVRPYWRLLLKVRAFVISLLGNERYSFEQRLFFVAWFAKRASPILNKKVMKADLAAIEKEMKSLAEEKILDELARRFDAAEAESAVALLVTRSLMHRRREQDIEGPTFRKLVDRVVAEYEHVRAFQPGDSDDAHAIRLLAEYRKRKARLHGPRVDQFLRNISVNYWMHRLPLEAPDLMVHTLRLLAILAIFKFTLISHPSLREDEKALDAAAVEVLYLEARYLEHSTLLTDLENALAEGNLRSLAGAIYLIRF